MALICALLLSGSDIRFLGTTGPEPEPDILYIPTAVAGSQVNFHPALGHGDEHTSSFHFIFISFNIDNKIHDKRVK